jgi:MFS family permease
MDVRSAAAKPLTHAETRLVILGVLVPVFMGSLDQTVLASALPTIGRAFADTHTLPWLITAYLIAATAVTPLYGKVSDIHGRRFTVLIALAIYMTGSLVCALAPNMLVLVLGRVLHGLGGGGLTSMGMVVLGDIAAPKDRAKYYFYFSATYTTAGAVGPALGGFFADYLHWSAIFWFNIPLGMLAIVLSVVLLRRLPRHERPHRLDFVGAILVVLATVALMLALTLGGVRYPWTSPPILALAALALTLGSGFVLRLLTAAEPLIPLAILKDPVARCAIAANAFGWSSIIGLNIVLPMYLQNVIGLSATAAGLSLMMLMVTLNATAGFSSPLLARATRYKRVPMLGLLLAIVAVLLLAWQADTLNPWTFQVLLLMIGIGFGPVPPMTSVALQNTVAMHQFGSAVGTMNFSRNLVATLLIAIFGALIAAGTSPPAPAELVPASSEAGLLANAAGYRWAFLAAAASLSAALLALFLLEEKPLQTNAP